MKKTVLIAITLIMCMALCACGKSEAAENVDSMISALGEVNLDSEDKVQEITNAISALTEKDQKALENLEILEKAKTTLYELKAQEVEKVIDSIGEISLKSEKAIKNARLLYSSLNEEVKAYVKNYDVLQEAVHGLNALKAQTVVELIDKIGTVTLENVNSVDAAVSAYTYLNEEQQATVSNYHILEAAMKAASELRVQAVIDAIDSITSASAETEDAFLHADSDYRKLSAEEKALVTNSDRLAELEEAFEALK